MLRFLFTISTTFLPLDEFQAEVLLEVAAKTIPPPRCLTSPAAVTEGDDTPYKMPGCHTSTPLPTNHHSWEAQQQLEAPPPSPSGGQVVPQCYQPPAMGNPASLLLDHTSPRAQGRMPAVTPTTQQLRSQCLGIGSAYASGSRTLMFTLKHESKLSFAGLGNVNTWRYQ